MYNLIIIDDEEYIRERLCRIFNWEAMGYRLLADFGGADSVLAYLSRPSGEKIDVIFTDIRLGDKSGLDLVKQVKPLFPDMAFVLISAYQDFEFARSAVSLGVFGYVLKPASYNSVASVFSDLKNHLNRRNEERKRVACMELDLCRRVITELVEEKIVSSKELENRFLMADLPSPVGNCSFALLAFHIKNYQQLLSSWIYGKDGFRNAVFQIVQTADMKTGIKILPVKMMDAKVISIAVLPNDAEGEASFTDILSGIHANLSEILKADASSEIVLRSTDFFSLHREIPAITAAEEDISGEGDFTNVIERAKRYIADNFNKDISLEDVANHVHLHAVYFSRYFKKAEGENYSDYLLRLRMERAAGLLIKTSIKTDAIGYKVGYKSEKHFYKLFKTYSGYTPAEYRKRALGIGNDYGTQE